MTDIYVTLPVIFLIVKQPCSVGVYVDGRETFKLDERYSDSVFDGLSL